MFNAHGYQRCRPDAAGVVCDAVDNGSATRGRVGPCTGIDLRGVGSAGGGKVFRLLPMVVALLLVATACGGTAASGGSAGPCGSAATPPDTYEHIVVVIMENRTWGGVGGVGFRDPAMPYLRTLADSCATFPDWTEIDTKQNSLTQYIGLTSGTANPRTVNDCDPSDRCRSTDDNLFRQVRIAGGTARTYVEGETEGCSASENAAKHIPALYYFGTYVDATGTVRNDQDFCAQEVRPLSDLDVSNLPTFAMIVPSLCNDGHDCGNEKVDAFARTWVSKVLDSPAYASGDTALMVLYDEDYPVPNLLVSPTARAVGGVPSGVGHAAMLRTWEEMLGLPIMNTGEVTAAPSLRTAAHI